MMMMSAMSAILAISAHPNDDDDDDDVFIHDDYEALGPLPYICPIGLIQWAQMMMMMISGPAR